jgi:hypothetical protein
MELKIQALNVSETTVFVELFAGATPNKSSTEGEIIIVMDTSGSMQYTLKPALKSLGNQLEEKGFSLESKIIVISFNDNAYLGVFTVLQLKNGDCLLTTGCTYMKNIPFNIKQAINSIDKKLPIDIFIFSDGELSDISETNIVKSNALLFATQVNSRQAPVNLHFMLLKTSPSVPALLVTSSFNSFNTSANPTKIKVVQGLAYSPLPNDLKVFQDDFKDFFSDYSRISTVVTCENVQGMMGEEISNLDISPGKSVIFRSKVNRGDTFVEIKLNGLITRVELKNTITPNVMKPFIPVIESAIKRSVLSGADRKNLDSMRDILNSIETKFLEKEDKKISNRMRILQNSAKLSTNVFSNARSLLNQGEAKFLNDNEAIAFATQKTGVNVSAKLARRVEDIDYLEKLQTELLDLYNALKVPNALDEIESTEEGKECIITSSTQGESMRQLVDDFDEIIDSKNISVKELIENMNLKDICSLLGSVTFGIAANIKSEENCMDPLKNAMIKALFPDTVVSVEGVMNRSRNFHAFSDEKKEHQINFVVPMPLNKNGFLLVNKMKTFRSVISSLGIRDSISPLEGDMSCVNLNALLRHVLNTKGFISSSDEINTNTQKMLLGMVVGVFNTPNFMTITGSLTKESPAVEWVGKNQASSYVRIIITIIYKALTGHTFSQDNALNLIRNVLSIHLYFLVRNITKEIPEKDGSPKILGKIQRENLIHRLIKPYEDVFDLNEAFAFVKKILPQISRFIENVLRVVYNVSTKVKNDSDDFMGNTEEMKVFLVTYTLRALECSQESDRVENGVMKGPNVLSLTEQADYIMEARNILFKEKEEKKAKEDKEAADLAKLEADIIYLLSCKKLVNFTRRLKKTLPRGTVDSNYSKVLFNFTKPVKTSNILRQKIFILLTGENSIEDKEDEKKWGGGNVYKGNLKDFEPYFSNNIDLFERIKNILGSSFHVYRSSGVANSKGHSNENQSFWARKLVKERLIASVILKDSDSKDSRLLLNTGNEHFCSGDCCFSVSKYKSYIYKLCTNSSYKNAKRKSKDIKRGVKKMVQLPKELYNVPESSAYMN